MSAEPIEKVVDLLDEKFNPVTSESKAKYKITYNVNEKGEVDGMSTEILLD